MKTRSQTSPKPLKTVAMAPRPSSTKRKPRPKPAGKGDPRAPKKPPTAFFYFMEDFRKIYKQEKPSVKSMQEIGKACGEKWNTMTFEEKVKYYDIATEKRAEFEKAMIEYNKKKVKAEHLSLYITELYVSFSSTRCFSSGDNLCFLYQIHNIDSWKERYFPIISKIYVPMFWLDLQYYCTLQSQHIIIRSELFWKKSTQEQHHITFHIKIYFILSFKTGLTRGTKYSPYSLRRSSVVALYPYLPSWQPALAPSARRSINSMACSFPPSSATRLHALDAAAAGVKNGRVPLKASVAPAQRALGCCRATARQEGATQEPSVAASSARAQLDLLEQLTSATPDDTAAGLENGMPPPEPRRRATIREQLSALAN
ncbi:hypothetical protein ACJX0J_018424, partial [Zea mays]